MNINDEIKTLDIDLIYKEKIERLAKEKKNEVFYNSSAEHAKVVVNAIAKNAEQYIKILCCSMCSDISNNDEYVESVKSFLSGNKERKIEILFTRYNNDFPEQRIAQCLKQYAKQVKIKKWGNSEEIKFKDRPVNFTVADDSAYRMETDIDKKMAFGNFNNPEGAKNLSSVFDTIFESRYANPVALPN